MKTYSIIFAALMAFFVGCSDATSGFASKSGPWTVVDDDKFGAHGGMPVGEGTGYMASNVEFRQLLMTIAADHEIKLEVEPESLLSRGIKIQVEGKDLPSLFENLAKQCSLQIENTSEGNWTIKDPKLADGSTSTISSSPPEGY